MRGCSSCVALRSPTLYNYGSTPDVTHVISRTRLPLALFSRVRCKRSGSLGTRLGWSNRRIRTRVLTMATRVTGQFLLLWPLLKITLGHKKTTRAWTWTLAVIACLYASWYSIPTSFQLYFILVLCTCTSLLPFNCTLYLYFVLVHPYFFFNCTLYLFMSLLSVYVHCYWPRILSCLVLCP